MEFATMGGIKNIGSANLEGATLPEQYIFSSFILNIAFFLYWLICFIFIEDYSS